MFDMPVIEHCEEQTLKGDGVAHEGFHASTLGLRGIPGEAESIMALRDISLAELTGGVVHIAHMSARQTLDAVRYGKARGVRVTCEVTPHHFILTDEMLGGAGRLRHEHEDESAAPRNGRSRRDARRASPTAASTSSRPITRRIIYDEKHVEFDRAPFGITGLETGVSLCFDRLVHAGVMTLSRLIELLSVNPARVIRRAGRLAHRGRARRHQRPRAGSCRSPFRRRRMRSKSKNTPFDGWTLRGGVAATIVGGRTVYRERGCVAQNLAM